MFSYTPELRLSQWPSPTEPVGVHDRKEAEPRSGFPCSMVLPASQYYFLFCIHLLPLFLCCHSFVLVALGLRCWCGLSLVIRAGLLRVRCTGFSLLSLLPLQSTVSKCLGFVAVDSSRTRDRTHIPRIGRWTPNHWATRKAWSLPLFVRPKELIKDSCFPAQADTTILNGWPQQKGYLNNVPVLLLVCVRNSQGSVRKQPPPPCECGEKGVPSSLELTW